MELQQGFLYTVNLGNKKIRMRVLGELAHAHNYCTFTSACLIVGTQTSAQCCAQSPGGRCHCWVKVLGKNLIFSVWAHHKGWNVLDCWVLALVGETLYLSLYTGTTLLFLSHTTILPDLQKGHREYIWSQQKEERSWPSCPILGREK